MEKEWPINKNFVIHNDGKIFNKAKRSFMKTIIRNQKNILGNMLNKIKLLKNNLKN